MNVIKTRVSGMLTLVLSQSIFAGKAGTSLMQDKTFQKTSSVLPAGARLVPGNTRKNEFYILGRMTTEEEVAPKIAPKLKIKTLKGKKVASKK